MRKRKNCFVTIDFEDWPTIPYLQKYHFKKNEFASFCDDRSLRPFFQKLADEGVSATVFVVGSIAENNADLLKYILKQGNLIGCHSLNHDNLKNMTTQSFLVSTQRAKETIEKVIGTPVYCYRAPFFSANKEKILSLNKLGFTIDSSYIDSQSNPYYEKNDFSDWHGDPNGFLRNDCTDLKELEIPCLSFFGRNIPIGGGGFFRLYPFFLYKILVRKYLSKHDSFVFFLHPYEINYHKFEGIKRMKMKDKFRFDFGRKNAQKKFWKLIRYLKKQGFTFNNPSFYLSKRDFEQ